MALTKIVVLGGAGAVGREAARCIAHCEDLEEIVIADRDLEHARAVSNQLEVNSRAVLLDVRDAASLRSLFGEVELVINTVGPFYQFGPPVLDAAIDVGTHYIDVCDDWEPSLEMIGRNERARDAGITAVSGMGYSPGASNLLAAAAIGQLDRADSVHTIWPIFEDDLVSDSEVLSGERPPGPSIVHLLYQLRGTIRVLEGGQMVDVPPLAPIHLTIPGFGAVQVWSVGHSEAVTLPLYFKQLLDCRNFMAATPPTVKIFRQVIEEVEALNLDNISCANLYVRRVREHGSVINPTHTPLADVLTAVAEGKYEGKPCRVSVTCHVPDGHPSTITGWPLAAGARMMIRGEVTRQGVFAPEAGIDQQIFFKRLAEHLPDDCNPAIKITREMI